MGLFDFLSPLKVFNPVKLAASAVQALKPAPNPPARKVTRLVVHCTAGPPTQPIAEILNYWKRVHPTWKGRPGYHIIIAANGTSTRLQPDSDYTNGVAGFNANSLHVCYTGGQNGIDTRTEAQKRELLRVLARWRATYPDAIICGHRDLSPDLNKDGRITPNEWIKQCPSFNAIPEYQHL